MACSLFGLGGRGSIGGSAVFQSARGNLPRRKPRYHSLGIRLVALGGFRRDHGVDQLLLRRGAHLTIYFCMGLGLALAFQWQKKVAPWIPAMTFGWFSQPPMNCTSSTRKPHGQSWGCAVGFRGPCGGVRSSLVPAALLGKTPYVAVMDVLLSM